MKVLKIVCDEIPKECSECTMCVYKEEIRGFNIFKCAALENTANNPSIGIVEFMPFRRADCPLVEHPEESTHL